MNKALLLPLLAPVVLLSGLWATPDASLEDQKPVAVLSVASYDDLLADVAYYGKITDNPDLAVGVEAMIKLFTKSQGLAGLDRTRPMGFVLQTDGRRHTGYAFAPVDDLDKLLAALRPVVGKAQDAGDGVCKIPGKGNKKPLYLKPLSGGWVVMADRPEVLSTAPADPAGLLGDMPEQYDLALRLLAGNVPERLKAKLIAHMNQGIQKDLKRRPGETDEEYAPRKKITEQLGRSLVAVVEDLDHVTLGWKLDVDAETTYLDVAVVARPGTPTAKQAATLEQTKSNFTGFLAPEATLAGTWSGKLPAQKAALLGTVVDAFRKRAFRDIEQKGKPEAEQQLARQMVGDVLDALQETIDQGVVDGGAAVRLLPEAVTLVAGGHVAEAQKIEKVAKQLAQIAETQNPAISDWINLDADQLQDISFHVVSVPVADDTKDREKVVALIGERLDVVVGIGQQRLYLAAGRDALGALKTVIERSTSAAESLPLRVSLALKPFAEFVAAAGKQQDRPRAALVAEILQEHAQTDHVNLTARPIANGVKYRLELEEGILKLIGRMALMPEQHN